MSIFEYSAGTARSYLAHLVRQELLQRTESGHALTSKGEDRLQLFEVSGDALISHVLSAIERLGTIAVLRVAARRRKRRRV